MAHSLVPFYAHIVFSTKDRLPFLLTPEARERTHAYLAGICKFQESPAVAVGGAPDHVHILCRLGKTANVADFVRELKRESSKWVKEQRPELASFYWQSGYGAFSISPGHVEKLVAYIAHQDEHHRTETFQDEFRRLLHFYGIEFDEKHLWD